MNSCFVGIKFEPTGRHPICNGSQKSGSRLQQGADIKSATCTIILVVISIQVWQEAVVLDE